MVNTTCPVTPNKPNDPKPFLQNGQLNFKAHDVGWIVCGIMSLISTITSAWLIWKHLTYYTLPSQQRHIVRLLVMVPVYSIVSFMSYLFYQHAIYYQTIRDCYEAVLITSFFLLICAYTGDTQAEQHAVFRTVQLDKWFWPLGSWKYRPDGLHFLWLNKIGILQYAIVRPVCTLVAVGLEYFGLYCLQSWMPWFGHVYISFFISVSVTIAMYCLIQLYLPIRKLVDPYKPILKLLAVKTIVFLTFWQDIFLSFLVTIHVIKETEHFTAEQIQAGINALLECFWMLIIGFVHIKAFTYLPYRPADRSRTTFRGKAALDCLDFRDWFFEMKDSTQYVAARTKGKMFTLVEDIRAERHRHLFQALGTERKTDLEREMEHEREKLPSFWKKPLDHDNFSSRMSIHSSGRLSDAFRNPKPQKALELKKPNVSRLSNKQQHAKSLADLEKMAAFLDEEEEEDDLDEADKLVSEERQLSHEPLDYISEMYANGRSNHPDMYPELTRYHTHVESQAERKQNLSAVEELEEEEENDRGLNDRPTATVPAPVTGVGAFGIVRWFSGRTGNGYAKPTETEEMRPFQPPERNRIEQLVEGSWGPLSSMDNPLERGNHNESPNLINPVAESPLSRLIHTHHNSLVLPLPPESFSTRLPPNGYPSHLESPIPRSNVTTSSRAGLALHLALTAPSSQQASIVPSDSDLSRKPTNSTSAARSDPSTRNETFVSFPPSCSSHSPPSYGTGLDDDASLIVSPPKVASDLAIARGPKGKPIPISIPSPLSPSRYPYSKASQAKATLTGSSASASLPATGRRARSHTQPFDKNEEGESSSSSKPVSKQGTVTIGPMSLLQHQARKEARGSKPLPQIEVEGKKRDRGKEGNNNDKGILVLAAPSQLAGSIGQDPYSAGQSVIRAAQRDREREQRRFTMEQNGVGGVGGGKTSWSGQTTTHSIPQTTTTFQVGSIVSRDAVLAASMAVPRRFS